jgi:competence protein ComEC
MVMLETLAAELMTLPLIMMTFGQLSVIGLLANVLVVPLIPFAMLFSAIAGTAGMALPALAGWAAWPANLLLTYMLDVVRLLSGIPGIFLHRSLSVTGMLALYGIIALALLLAQKHRPQKKAATEGRGGRPALNTLNVLK